MTEDLSMYSARRRKNRPSPSTSGPIKNISSKSVTVELGKKTINLPTIEAVQMLEKENQELRRNFEHLKTLFNQMQRDISTLRKKEPAKW